MLREWLTTNFLGEKINSVCSKHAMTFMGVNIYETQKEKIIDLGHRSIETFFRTSGYFSRHY